MLRKALQEVAKRNSYIRRLNCIHEENWSLTPCYADDVLNLLIVYLSFTRDGVGNKARGLLRAGLRRVWLYGRGSKSARQS